VLQGTAFQPLNVAHETFYDLMKTESLSKKKKKIDDRIDNTNEKPTKGF
jgi:hypothetical protein